HAASISPGMFVFAAVTALGPAPSTGSAPPDPPAERAAGGRRSLLADLPVDGLPDEAGVAVLPRMALDHVREHPAQARRSAVRPASPSRLRQPAGGVCRLGGDSGPRDRLFPQIFERFGVVISGGLPFPVRRRGPVDRSPRFPARLVVQP